MCNRIVIPFGYLVFVMVCQIWFSTKLQGQILHDKWWVLGNYVYLEFSANGPSIERIPPPPHGIVTGIYQTATSDKEGNLLFHTSGCSVMNKDSYVMKNGDSLNLGALEYGYCSFGEGLWDQNTISLPLPGSDSLYILFNLDMGTPFPWKDTMYGFFVPLHLQYHFIDMSLEDSLGAVTEKNIVAIEDTLARGYIQACKHANGRDWWVTVPEWNSNCYYVFYVGPHGIDNIQKYCGGLIAGDKDFGEAVSFSRDGQWYARSHPWMEGSQGQVDLFSFDRCSGQLDYIRSLHFPIEMPYFTGLSFSPNSRFLYLASWDKLWQFDLQDPDMQESRVLVGEMNDINFAKGSFFALQTGLDGRIYINSPGGHHSLSTINFPDRKGVDCQVKIHNIALPSQNYRGLPNFPYYRLGPDDSSPCDTLDINNLPVSMFRFEFDSVDMQQVHFYDLSYFEPDTWHWDFGDGQFSSDIDPVHSFEGNETREICLTVSNDFGEHTWCQTISFLVHTVESGEPDKMIYPNPASDEINIDVSNDDIENIQIYNYLGTMVYNGSENKISLGNLPSGYYYVMMQLKNTAFKVSGFIKTH